mmetsp:Transcript_29241/g.78523  ORF Transcript_29241/g.78523 Transcript_29241/m.78523 type:complete len:408 (+) Transcript_29241:97-1320(+)
MNQPYVDNGTMECMLCCEHTGKNDIVTCTPMTGKTSHIFCRSCMAKDVSRVCAEDVDFDSLCMRNGRVLCPHVQDVTAWKTLYDFHLANKLSTLIEDEPDTQDEGDPVSWIMDEFENFMMNMEKAIAHEALATCGCPCMPFSDRTVAMCTSEREFDMYTRALQRVRDDATFVSAQGEVESCIQELREAFTHKRQYNLRNKLFAMQLRNQMPRARQCPKCSFGPIDHFGCGDLQAHQGQRVGSARISNRCPKCDFFSPELRDWPTWDGELTPCLGDVIDFGVNAGADNQEPAAELTAAAEGTPIVATQEQTAATHSAPSESDESEGDQEMDEDNEAEDPAHGTQGGRRVGGAEPQTQRPLRQESAPIPPTARRTRSAEAHVPRGIVMRQRARFLEISRRFHVVLGSNA